MVTKPLPREWARVEVEGAAFYRCIPTASSPFLLGLSICILVGFAVRLALYVFGPIHKRRTTKWQANGAVVQCL